MSPHRVGYLWLPHLPIQAVWRRHPALRETPILLALQAGCTVVSAVGPDCLGAGVTPGMLLRTALELVPAATVLPADPAGDAALLTQVLDLLARWSEALEPDGHTGAWFVPACAARPADERRLGAAVLDGLAVALGLEAHLGIASGKFAARCAAQQAPAGDACIIAPEDTAAFLAPLPLALLPLSPQTLARLHLLGVRTIGDYARLPTAGLRRRFGAEAERAHRLAYGIDDTPLVPRVTAPQLVAQCTFEPPIVDRLVVHRTAAHLLDRLCRRLKEAGQTCRSLCFSAVLEDGRQVQQRVALRAPAHELQRLVALLHRLVEALALPAPAGQVTVRLEALAPVQPVQLPLDAGADVAEDRRRRARAAWTEVARRYPHLPRRIVPGATPASLLIEQRLLLVPDAPDGMDLPAEPAVRLRPVRLLARGARVWVRLPGPPAVLEEIVARHACWGADEWWPQMVQRVYYRVRTRHGLVLTLAYEPAARRWLLVEQVD